LASTEEEAKKNIIECSIRYSLLNENGEQAATGDCKGTIDKEYLTVLPKFGSILPFHLRDINEIEAENYQITLPLSSKEKLTLFNLGYCFEDFARVLTDLRNEVIIKDLLMNETVRKSDINMEFSCYDEKGSEKQKGVGKIRLYETGLVVIPKNGEIMRVPYSDVTSVSDENYSIRISTELGEQLLLQKMGQEFDPFLREFSNIYDELQTRAVSAIKTLFPAIDSVSLRKVAAIMKEGKAAKRADIESINPRLWQELEKKIASAGLNDSYSFLKELGQQEKTAIGFKQGLMGDLTGEYVWFLVPVYGGSDKGYGNAVAMEAAEPTTEETGGKATYFFKIVSRKDYSSLGNSQELDKEMNELIERINRCMLDINFRREPIYLPDERLEEAEYVRYKTALRKIPSLQLLRNLYIGRVIHSSLDQWKSDIMNLLTFNLSTQDDAIRWKK
jgi:hypothetical protein